MIRFFKFFTLFVFLCSFLGACKHSENPERQKLYDDVMTIHDEVMPEMKTINMLERALKKKSSNIQNQDSLIMVNGTLKRVEEAGKGMMNWMHELDVPGKKVPDAEAIAYFKVEKQKIIQISRKMKKAIMSGNAILESK